MGDSTNNQNDPIEVIRSAFRLIEGECRIERRNFFYVIKPANEEEKLEINVRVANIDIFNQYYLILENCVFNNEVFFNNQVFLHRIEFEHCIFETHANFTGTTFNEIVRFCGSTFKKGASFLEATFEKWANFSGGTLQWMSFSYATFKKGADFSETTFKKWVDFSHVTFEKKADFSGANFKKEVDISDMELTETEKFSITLQKGEAIFLNTTFKEDVDFSNSIFEQQALFLNATFSNYANFNNVEFVDKADFLRVYFGSVAYFLDSYFKENACFKNVTFQGNANFDHVEFQVGEDCKSESIANFSGAHFKERAHFTKTYFHKMANFSNVIFDHHVYFDKTNFKEEVSFNHSEFYKNVDFYKTKFKKIPKEAITQGDIPDFFQTTFNGNIKLTGIKLFDLDFEQLKILIEKKEGNKMNEFELSANEFRNVFIGFKDGLIKISNLIDALHFHKLELYARELELEYKSEKNIKDWVEKFQLMFYRLTSDHHTDLLLILNNVLGLIVLFGAFVCGLCYFANYDIKCVDYECCSFTEAYYLYSLMTNSSCVDCSMWNIFCIEAVLIIVVCCAFVAVFILLMFFFNYVNSICRELGYWFIVFFIFVLFILAVKPALILPIFGKLIDESLKIDFPAFTSLSIVYAILMFLLIWSLQKTARKNTIVPN